MMLVISFVGHSLKADRMETISRLDRIASLFHVILHLIFREV